MARTVDPARHAERRLHIIDAAITCFARDGYAGATTAAICREAGIGSGTFFHYFPTKRAVLVDILELDRSEQEAWFAGRERRTDPLGVVQEYVARAADEMRDARLPGFVVAVAAVMDEPEVKAALRSGDNAARAGLGIWLGRAQQAGQVRMDLTAGQLASWVMVLINGFIDELLAGIGSGRGAGFSAGAEAGNLQDAVTRILSPAPLSGNLQENPG